ncbi:2,4-dienoyl-CoA reductase-like NADH-dependent reductase (Old Yellow Enzyme family)/pyruvate/2-oxoglutarate dehydrogenase complex dihydrolipoamide dehydrogenase (E3) component [Anaerosolibacter carboniphilus]|uniref:2,4-dienoyl-CoA reductase-like NADH-dependent reductase (Old Yellow Enzyme family)/pyruvate/2-oxoglutarate dehydrogenase complex dihydrolipoamide dehydrogenase (E3) component n=1 Tax=Anaerosolibacter carboniphilus TaxID=1417629 RepID=A0A841KZ45_9FIRM|nr:FAD-dependent oxidoreductase [Anaerosolibacter carboniphilus]MBB6218627.1 2,4-dienoyl-CoA reductase-like NADH-dependent reductase (Old Yellow Enzyme family)/pyruvate/2-oxoglutarate dehydrogenase complex dihydrolipoamide dehydrogenase (E3) component [Anaerosolibacter carboniphilus]
MYEKIFEPARIGNLELKNRIIVTPISTVMANEDGSPSEKYIRYLEEKAKGNFGLIVTEYYVVEPKAGLFTRCFNISSEELIEKHSEITKRVHAAGGKISAQINHGGRQIRKEIFGKKLIAPSSVRDFAMRELPRELTIEEIHNLVEGYGDTALNLKKAGFDAVEIYGCHGFLVSQFLSRSSNKRTDEYGGSLQGRCRFVVEIIQNIRKKVGKDFPVTIRISTEEFVPGGLTLEENKAIAVILENAGVDAISCSKGVFITAENIAPPNMLEHAGYVNNAAEIKKVVNIPVIFAGRVNDPAIAESILRSGKADFVGMARASLADPQFLNKVKEGRLDDIQYCIGCNQGCVGSVHKGMHVCCLVNPFTGREDEIEVKPADVKKKIIVVGGGIAGCEAALMAAKRGHDVTIYEGQSKLGGQWNLAGIPPGKTELLSLLTWQKHKLDKYGVKVVLNTHITVDMVQAEKPDEVIIGTGATPFTPPINGIHQPHVVSANDVLSGKEFFGKNVVVIGGGLVAAETAEFIASYGSIVTMIESADEILKGMIHHNRNALMKNLKHHEIEMHTSSSVTEIQSDAVLYEYKGKQYKVEEVNTVVVAIGSRPLNELESFLKAAGISTKVIGDAAKVRNGLDAVYEGFMAGITV